MSKRLVRITNVRPESHSVDCVDIETGAPVAGVTVVTGQVTGNTGLAALAMPADDRYVYGLMEMVSGVPLITGFLPPRVCELLFADGRAIARHESDVYSSLDKLGNFEWRHPSGTYIRVATDAEHEDLAGLNHDQNWAITRNTGQAVHVRLQVANTAGVKATLTITPDGAITIDTRGTIAVTADGEVTITTPKATVNGDAEVTGTVKMAGGAGNCVTTESICAFLGSPHPDGSTKVTAGS